MGHSGFDEMGFLLCSIGVGLAAVILKWAIDLFKMRPLGKFIGAGNAGVFSMRVYLDKKTILWKTNTDDGTLTERVGISWIICKSDHFHLQSPEYSKSYLALNVVESIEKNFKEIVSRKSDEMTTEQVKMFLKRLGFK